MKAAWKVVLIAGLVVAPALGQDSVSNNLGALPGDALSPWNTTHQCADYVVDLGGLHGSWGTYFKIAPLVKANKSDSDYFNCQISAQGMSRLQQLNVPFPYATYDFWTVAGDGVHPTYNNTPGTLSPLGDSNQFAVAFAEYGYTDADASYGGIIGAVVNYEPTDPDRLYVHRVTAATNSNNNTENRSQFGMGAVDETGAIMFRADDYSVTGPNPIVDDNIFRVDTLARTCGVVNYVDNAGLADTGAGAWIVMNQATSHGTPNIGPTGVFGTPAFYLGGDYNGQFAYGTANAPTYTTAHWPAGYTATRGNVSYITQNHPCIGGTHGTCAQIFKADSQAAADTIGLWGLTSTGAVAAGSPTALTLPATIVDNVTLMTNAPGTNEFDHYHSDIFFRGGNGQVSMNVDQEGRLLVAAVVYEPTTYTNNPDNYIACARLADPGCTPEWSMVAYSCDTTLAWETGKPILDGPGGNMIGRLTTMDELTGGLPYGPSMSAPMIDSAGNVWFIGAAAFYKEDSQGQPYTDTDSALIRAVYYPDYQGTGLAGWELELIFEVGYVFHGQNSGVDYQIQFMGIADSNSVAAGTAWSGNISEKAHLGVAPAGYLFPRHPSTLGGIIASVDICYDVNDDGTYDGDEASLDDENYNVLMYVGSGCVLADSNVDGVVNNFDIDGFVLAITNPTVWETTYPNGDIVCANDTNGDGVVDNFDIDGFVNILTAK